MNAAERKVSGSSRNCTAPISDSSRRTISASPLESAPNAAAEQDRAAIRTQHAGEAAGEVGAERSAPARR